MDRIIVLMGKSASGKDSVFHRIIKKHRDSLKTVTPYTTRPRREGEKDGREYHFIDEEGYRDLKKAGRIIEDRSYETVRGLWRYFTVRDESFEDEKDIILIGTLDTFLSLKRYFKGKKEVIPVYIECDDGDRLIRAVKREKKRDMPQYSEMCRRFLSDEEDFSEDKLEKAGVKIRVLNDSLKRCVEEVAEALWT